MSSAPERARVPSCASVAAQRAARGRSAELAVADYLRVEGFAILERNVRVGHLELDLVGRRGNLIVVVEVRTRGPGSFERPFESIGPAKRARIRRAVDRLWRRRLAAIPGIERVRIDAAAVSFVGGQTRVEYVQSAVSG